MLGQLKKKSLAGRYAVSGVPRLVVRLLSLVVKDAVMGKRELIDYICEINKGAKPDFLANFSEEELNAYLEHLMELDLKELAVCA